MPDAPLTEAVNDELFWDPKVDPVAIAAEADYNGHVTLRGTVGSFRQKHEAKRAAERVVGVTKVKNELQVQILNADRRDDSDIRGAVLQALMLDSLVPSTIDVQVKDGFVTLTGSATWQFERDEAEIVVMNVIGVTGLEDEIYLTGELPDAYDITDSIKKALKRNAKLDANDVSVSTRGKTVTISGVVSSWSEHDAAIDAAWAAPGVHEVEDHVLVEY
jgi:osmotically-inducible protein OsmY